MGRVQSACFPLLLRHRCSKMRFVQFARDASRCRTTRGAMGRGDEKGSSRGQHSLATAPPRAPAHLPPHPLNIVTVSAPHATRHTDGSPWPGNRLDLAPPPFFFCARELFRKASGGVSLNRSLRVVLHNRYHRRRCATEEAS